MESISIPLTESMKDFIAAEVVAGGFASPTDYVAALIKAAQEQKTRAKVEALLEQGLCSPASEMTHQDWEEIRAEGLKRLAENQS